MSETRIAHFESKRNIAFKRLSDARVCARQCKTDPNVLPRFETWCSRIESLMESFTEAHIAIISEMKCAKVDQDKIDLETSHQEQADDIYSEILETQRELCPPKETKVALPQPQSIITNQESKSFSKLPPIKLPSFSGELKDFPGYIDLFNTLVHQRTDLSNVEKFQYLSASLTGEPVNTIRAFPISEANYTNAYQALVKKYDDKRYLSFVCWEQIINLKPMTSESVQQLRHLLDTFSENISMLRSIGLPTKDWDFILFHSLLTKLDKVSRDAFELSFKGIVFPKFKDLESFLQERCAALERSARSSTASVTPVNQINNKPNINQPKQVRAQQAKPAPTMLLAETSISCILCKDNHALYRCPTFLAKTPQERSKTAKQHKLCLNCLRSNHSTDKCVSDHSCKKCGRRHNSLLHFASKGSNQNEQMDQQSVTKNQASMLTTSTSEENVVTPVTSLSNTSSSDSKSSFVMLATAEVEVKDSRGSYQKVRVLIDPGSQSHIITNTCVNRLGLIRYKANTPMSGIGETPTQSNSKVFLEIRPLGKPEPVFTTEALILNKICGDMPTHAVKADQFKHLSNIKLADEQYHKPRPIDILIGGEIFPQILIPGKIEGGDRAATAINTIFGYVLMGKTTSSYQSSGTTPVSINHVSMDSDLDIAIQKFWELDNIPESNKSSLSAEDIRCEEIYQKTHQRDADGRYIVRLPFREDHEPSFDNSYSIALRRFYQLEKRLVQNPKLHQEYQEHVMEYLSSGQMEAIPPDECQSLTAYYIPHHAVVKPDRKLRVVYDASTKDKKGVSLNDTLLTGPKLQANISDILLRFRLHSVVFTADVRQMYRRIIITKDHTDYQRIVFRSSPDQTIQEYRLNRVTFGVSSAPFLAIRTMLQLAQDEQHAFPIAAEVLRKDLYVDDVVTGAPDTHQASVIKQQLVDIMKAAGFELRKWSSNHEAVLQDIPEEHKAVPDVTFDSDSNFVKVLGLAWNSKQDIFNYQVHQIPRECTKRSMLSELARVYDPIGLLTPLTFRAKHLIQRLWLLGTSWDQPVPEDIKEIWTRYMHQLPNLAHLHIPRRITRDDAVSYQIHGFCDASEAGYAGAVYLRSSNQNHHHTVALISAKSRVAPTKRRSLPRLELCGASMLADLMHHIINIYSSVIKIDSIHAWSDSMIVLAWIKSNSTSFKAFVGNRISNIQRKIPEATWKHVPGKQNPADCASRGKNPEDLINHDLWWTGPEWLSQDSNQWPNEPISTSSITCEDDPEIACEQRRTVLNTTIINLEPLEQLINKYSSLRKIQRIVAYCRRFVDALRKNKRVGHFTEQELHEALMVLVKHTQRSEFSEDIKNIQSGRMLSKPMRKLNAFIDDQQVFRVGGRLARSDLEFQAKHPALLPRKHRLTKLIIQCVHNENFHPGLQTLQYLLLQNFWILSPRRVITSVISNCYRCFRIKPTVLQPKMADLPKARITQIKAFQSVGCDYAGPFNITVQRYRGARTMKAYLCLFVCFATKALHLELASDLSSEAFLAALRRFIARRGRCNTIHCDCGTNFKGAQTLLADLMRSACETERIEFKFNPPGAPHFGGIWEAGVKSVKTHLYRVIGTQTLTYEELNTLLTQVESILNSRPLCPISSDPNDLSVLTPGHFLTLAPLTTVPSPDYTNTSMNRLTRWQLLQRMHQDFWSRWHNEYLTTLSQRLKWTKSSQAVTVDQLVIIKDELTHPLRWRFGRIIELFPGRDGIPRSATIRTAQGIMKRPLVKLCPIPNGCNY